MVIYKKIFYHFFVPLVRMESCGHFGGLLCGQPAVSFPVICDLFLGTTFLDVCLCLAALSVCAGADVRSNSTSAGSNKYFMVVCPALSGSENKINFAARGWPYNLFLPIYIYATLAKGTYKMF